MAKKKVIILGGGGFAKEIAGVLFRLPKYEFIGFLDDDKTRKSVLGKPNLGGIFPINKKLKTKYVALGIGHVGKTIVRNKIINEYEKAGYIFETIVSPASIVTKSVTLGKGSYVADGAVIQPDTHIADYAIINSNSFIGHDGNIGRNTHICPGVMVAGNVKIGNDSFLGIGSNIVHGITIGNECSVPAGQTVIKNLRDTEKIGLFKFK